MPSKQRENATLFRAFHGGFEPLVLPNAWDVASARIFEEAHFAAVATTSAGIAFSCGYPDGEHIPLGRMLDAITRICNAVSVPVTADLEAGYGSSPEEVERAAQFAIEAGVVGLNIQDGTNSPDSPLADLPCQLEKLKAVRRVSARMGVDVVLNARVDVYLRRVGSAAEQLAETLLRGEAYREAGADCIFVPGLHDKKIISALVRQLGLPINILAGSGCPTVGELQELGVARITLGSGPMRATCSLLQRMSREILTEGTYSMLEDIVSHATMNGLMRNGHAQRDPFSRHGRKDIA